MNTQKYDAQKEICVANVKNWLMRIAEGAKAAHNPIQFAPAEPDEAWRVTARCYDEFKEGVPIHNLTKLADAIDIPPVFVPYENSDYFYGIYTGYYYIELFGVRFYDYGERVSTDEGK